MNFEVFESDGPTATQEPRLSVYKNLDARVNAAADAQWFEDYDRATLFTDAENTILGIKPGVHADTSYSLSRDDRRGADLSTRLVLLELGFDEDTLDETQHATLEYDDEHELVVADLAPLLDDGSEEGDQGATDEADTEATQDADEAPEDVDVPDEDLSDAERLLRHLRNRAPVEATAEEIGEPIGLGARSVGYYLPRADYDDVDVEKVSDDVPAVWRVTPSSAEDGDDADKGENDGADDQEDDEADAGDTHEPNPTTSPDHERVHHAIDETGVTSVEELADVLDETVGRARTLARVTDRYGELDDKPSDGVRA